ncbi:MAG: prepilin peptidase [Rhodospirillaceae bacterium]
MAPLKLYSIILMVVLTGSMVVAIAHDIASFEIPDSLSIILIVAGVAGLLTGGQGWSGLLSHGLQAFAAFAFGVLMFGLGQWGGGDVKLIAATSLWLNGALFFSYLLLVALAGGVLAIVILLFRRCPLPVSWQARPWLLRLHQADQGLPYGVALGFGGLAVARSAVDAMLGIGG